MRLCAHSVALLLATFVSVAPCAAKPDAHADETLAPRKLLTDVARRLAAVADPPPGLEWPPALIYSPEGGVFAGTTMEQGVVTIYVTKEMMDRVVQGEEDPLAFILGHEMAHGLLGHLEEAINPAPAQSAIKSRAPFVEVAFGRQQELAADSLGLRLALAAGFSYRDGLLGMLRMRDLGLDYSSFEGAGLNHPTWPERMARIDSSRATPWRSIGAFDNGTVFLLIEQYSAAARCFQAVVAEENFPSCAEAWANLGHALLMQYCDALDPGDLREFGVGQLVTTGFYRRPVSLEAQVRGIDKGLWWDAVGALREAIRLDPTLTLAKADLGVAHLLGPAGKDVGEAARYLSEASAAARKDESLDPLVRAAILINAGVGELAAPGRAGGAEDPLAETKRLLQANLGLPATRAWEFGTVVQSLYYNRGFQLAASPHPADRRAAVEILGEYLANTNRASAWWQLARERYDQLRGDLAIDGPTFEDTDGAAGAMPFRPVVSVTTAGNGEIALTDRIDRLRKQLGDGEIIQLVPGAKLQRIRYRDVGVDVLAGEEVVAIVLADSSSPPVTLRPPGAGSVSQKLRVGMTIAELDQVLGDRPYDIRSLLDPRERYRFYRDAGMGIRVTNGRVVEIVVAQIPLREG